MTIHDAREEPLEDLANAAVDEPQGLPAGAEGRRQEAAATFANVGRLHAFLEKRGKATGWRATAPLAAMKYICQLERICNAVERFLANTAKEP